MFDPVHLPRRVKSALILGVDIVLLPLALWAAFGFRLGLTDPSGMFGLFNPLSRVSFGDLATIMGACIVALIPFRLHLIKLHAIDTDAVMRIAAYSFAIMAIAAVGAFFLEAQVPRSVAVYFGAIFFLGAVLVRFAALAFLRALNSTSGLREPVAIYGAGSAGLQLATSLKRSREVNPVMFVDDNPAMRRVIVSGIKVRSPASLEKAVRTKRIRQVLVAIPSLSNTRRAELVQRLSALGCEVKIIPSYVDLVSGRHTVNDLRPVSPDELLGRDKVDLDTPEIAKAYAGRCVLVTGAGGSIGSELCNQLLNCAPARIVLLDRSEPALYEVDRLLRQKAAQRGIDLSACLASVTDRAAVDAVIAENGVDVILHAAAYKHVPIVEANEVEGARNNVMGTSVMTEAAHAAGIERFILVSTDKAVRPTNIMGATKRLAELVTQDTQRRSEHTKFSMVRFGNVLGSSGSVVPLFTKQIAQGGPVTVTHKDVTRYFMTIPEAARLVLLAGAFSQGSDLFVLNMGEPIKIMDLARRMIELSGRTVRDETNPEGDIAIEVTGLRPGEKLYEELLIDDESLTETPHEKILRARVSGLSSFEVAAMLRKVRTGLETRDPAIIRSVVQTYVDGYRDASQDDTKHIQAS